MNGVKQLTDKIKEDAKAEADKIMKEAKEEVAELKDKVNSEIKEKKEKIKEETEKKIEQEKKRIESSANLKIHNLQLRSKEDLIQEAFKKSKEKISEIRDKKRYQKALEKIAEESMEGVEKEDIEMRFSEEDKNVGNKVAKKYDTEVGDSAPIEGGIILRTKDGKFVIDNSIERRFERQKQELRGEIADILFEQEK